MIFNKKIDVPYIVYEMATKCNLNCKYCYNYWKANSKSYLEEYEQYKPLNTLKKIFKYVNIRNITFSGGEPTINYEELIDCIIFSKLKGKKVTLITNGTLLNEEKINQLIKLKVDMYELTINSYDKSIHENMNGVKDSFDKTVNTIKLLVEKEQKVTVPIVITKYNCENITKTLEFIKSLGAKNIMLNRYNIGGNGVNNPSDVSASKEQLRKAFFEANEFAKRENIKLYSLVCTPNCLLNPKDYSNIVFSHCQIDSLKRPFTLGRNGDIRFCNHSPIAMGNIFNQSFEEILKNDYLNKWKNIEPKFCKDCEEKKECKYGCRAASEQVWNTLEREDPIIEYLKVDKPTIKN